MLFYICFEGKLGLKATNVRQNTMGACDSVYNCNGTTQDLDLFTHPPAQLCFVPSSAAELCAASISPEYHLYYCCDFNEIFFFIPGWGWIPNCSQNSRWKRYAGGNFVSGMVEEDIVFILPVYDKQGPLWSGWQKLVHRSNDLEVVDVWCCPITRQ